MAKPNTYGKDLQLAFLEKQRKQSLPELRARDLEAAKAIRDRLDENQKQFLSDQNKFVALICGRQGGKSFVIGADAAATGLEKPGAKICYISLSDTSAKNIIWADLEAYNDDFQLGWTFNVTDSIVRFPNGSRILVKGSDTEIKSKKFRGQRFDKVYVDEAGEFTNSALTTLVNDALPFTVAAKNGQIILAGTPGFAMNGLWFSITRKDATPYRPNTFHGRPFTERTSKKWENVKFKWSVHYRTVKDNVKQPHIWANALREKEEAGIPDSDPSWRREALGEWVDASHFLLYPYREKINDWKSQPERALPTDSEEERFRKLFGLPKGHTWETACAIDLGFDDPTAIVVGAYSETCTDVYLLYAVKESGDRLDVISERYNEVAAIYGPFTFTTVDYGNALLLMEELESKYGLDAIPAPKDGVKRQVVAMVATAVSTGRLKVRVPHDGDPEDFTEGLIEEWQTLKVDAKGKLPVKGDDCAEAVRYLYKLLQPYILATKTREEAEASKEAKEQEEKLRIIAQLDKRRLEKTNFEAMEGFTNPLSFDDHWSN